LSSQQVYDDYEPPRGIWTRVKERVFGVEELEYEDEPMPAHEPRRRSTLRVETARGIRVAVRRHASTFADARVAADGLKNGQQQIVNLESATPQMKDRIVDFLNGVTYALDGCVERIGDGVYLFAPANVDVELDGPDR
jgi:cell division inhibitor SepF